MKNSPKDRDKPQEAERLAIIFSNVVFVFLIAISILLAIYEILLAIYEIYHDNQTYLVIRTFYLLIGVISAALFGLGLKQKNSLKVNLMVFLVTLGISLYAIEIVFTILDPYTINTSSKAFEDKGAKWDYRTKHEYIEHLKEKSNNPFIYPHYNPGWLISSDFLLNFVEDEGIKEYGGGGLYPLSNISNSTIVHCNEYGIWQYFETGKHGFNNPKHIIDTRNSDNITLLGDSFVEGFCVPNGQDIGSQLRALGYNVNNLGKAGGGVIHYNAIYREYSKPNADFTPDYVILFLYFINDTYNEYSLDIYSKYINDQNFSQDLINRRQESDNFQKTIFQLASNHKALEKYPQLSHSRQDIHVGIKELEDNNTQFVFNRVKSVIKLQTIRRSLTDLLIKGGWFGEGLKLKGSPEEKKELVVRQIEMISNEISKEAKFILVYLPSFREIMKRDYTNSNYIKRNLHTLDIDYIDMNSKFSEYELSYIFNYGLPGHYSVKGYRLVVEAIVEKLEADKFVPSYSNNSRF